MRAPRDFIRNVAVWMDERDLNPEARLSRAALLPKGPPRDDHIVTPSQTPVNAHIATLSPARANPCRDFACPVACLLERHFGSVVRRRVLLHNDLSPRLPPPLCLVRSSACRTARSAVAAAIRRFNGSPLKLCSVSRRPHGSDSLPERRFRISRRLMVLRSRALSARREFYLLWAWLFHPSALVFARQRGPASSLFG